jgi:hypothetical protein
VEQPADCRYDGLGIVEEMRIGGVPDRDRWIRHERGKSRGRCDPRGPRRPAVTRELARARAPNEDQQREHGQTHQDGTTAESDSEDLKRVEHVSSGD